jgi:hypothetical protein
MRAMGYDCHFPFHPGHFGLITGVPTAHRKLPWKAELVYMTGFPTREAAKKELFAYIEGYCNRQWLHSAVGYIMPERAE